jgi:hypothetical protein
MNELINEISNQLDATKVGQNITDQQQCDFESNIKFNMLLHEQEGEEY